MPTLAILKAGQHTDQAGQPLTLNAEQLRSIAEAYQPDKHEAPLVIGHPRHNAPAYGWVKALHVRDGVLEADLDQVDNAVQELIQNGAYKKISASFYPPDSDLNPFPGQFSLRHVGLLGAEPPAIKGLPAINFAETTNTTIEWSDTSNPLELLQRLQRWLVRALNEETVTSPVEQHGLGKVQPRTVCFTEIAASPPYPGDGDEVSTLIHQARERVDQAAREGRTLGFAEAVTIAQQEK